MDYQKEEQMAISAIAQFTEKCKRLEDNIKEEFAWVLPLLQKIFEEDHSLLLTVRCWEREETALSEKFPVINFDVLILDHQKISQWSICKWTIGGDAAVEFEDQMENCRTAFNQSKLNFYRQVAMRKRW